MVYKIQKESGILKIAGIVLGVITALLGIYAFCVPLGVFLGISWVIAILIIVNGVESIADGAASSPKKDVAKMVLGALIVLAGVFLLFSGILRFLTDMMMVYLIGGALIVYGVFQIVEGIRKRAVSTGACVLSVICGVISVIGGFLAFGHPFLTMVSVGYIIAFNLIMQGVNMIVIALNRDRM